MAFVETLSDRPQHTSALDYLEMTKLISPYRRAKPSDAAAMTELVNFAGEGLPLYLWAKMAGPGESPWAIGEQRAKREEGGFSYKNTVVREGGDRVVAALIGYPLPDRPAVVDYNNLPAMFVPLQELEDLVAGTWYVNVLATYPEYRSKGYGAELLSVAEQLARESQRNGLSIIVSDANAGARRLYERNGYRELASRGMVKESWQNSGENWVLLRKSIK